MRDDLSEDELSNLERLEKKADPGPWSTAWCYGACRHIVRNVDTDAFCDVPEATGWGRYDGDFIATMRNVLPRLLAEIRYRRELEQGQEYR